MSPVRKPSGPPPSRPLDLWLAFLFGCAALAVVLWLAFRGPAISDHQFEILRTVLALAGAGIAAIIPGFLNLSVTTGTKHALRAGGALGVFVVLYFWSPAHWQAATASVTQHTDGPNAPAQNGNGNTVTINAGPPR